MTVTIHVGDCREVLKTLPSESVHCIVTSPPYFGLRDYGVAEQIGLEPTPDAFVSELVSVFREARRVLRDDGTLWLNLGDSYSNGGGSHDGRGDNQSGVGAKRIWRDGSGRADGIVDERGQRNRNGITASGLPSKNLIGIPWRVAFALQADGWYLRQDIIWHKPNPMPESVTDRCTKAHEYVFLLAKSSKYHYDADAVSEDAIADHGPGNRTHKAATAYDEGDDLHRTKAGLVAYSERQRAKVVGRRDQGGEAGGVDLGMYSGRAGDRIDGKRNRRSVWSITTQPYSEAHFATMAPELAETCIKAGCPKGGTVLDPFGGAGTTGLVADRLHRNAILIELNPAYAELARNRISDDAGMFGAVA